MEARAAWEVTQLSEVLKPATEQSKAAMEADAAQEMAAMEAAAAWAVVAALEVAVRVIDMAGGTMGKVHQVGQLKGPQYTFENQTSLN